jgi:hypothetical protein
MLTPKKPGEADKVAKIASDFGLVSPGLAHRAARTAQESGGLAAALALIDKAIAHQGDRLPDPGGLAAEGMPEKQCWRCSAGRGATP